MTIAERSGARAVLVGDVKQLGSVEAGRAFGQVQDAGMKTYVPDKIVRPANDLTREAVEAMIAGDGARALAALDRGGGRIAEPPVAGDRRTSPARDIAALSPKERARTLVMDTTREGPELLTDAIRAELQKDGTITDDSMRMATLENRGLTREEARQASGFEKGDVVTFRRDYERHGVAKGQVYCIDSIDRENNRITLTDQNGRGIDWRLDNWGRGQSETYGKKEREFAKGDRVQFTRNDRDTGRVNGLTGNVTAIDAEKRAMTVRDARG